MKHLCILLMALATLSTPVAAQSISLSQSVDRTDMAFEDTLVFEIDVKWQGSPIAYRFDHAIRLTSEKLKVAGFSSTVSSEGKGDNETTTKKLVYRLSPKLSGAATIDPVAVEYVAWPDSTPGVLMTDPVQVTVAQPVPQAKKKAKGISTTWFAAMGGLLIVAVAVAVYSATRRRKTTVEPPKSPTTAAIEQLAAARQKAGNDLKVFQTGVYKMLTGLMASRYRMAVAGMSTPEIVEALESAEKDQSVRDHLATWLTRAEKEKYSPVAAPPGEVIRLETEMRRFLESLP